MGHRRPRHTQTNLQGDSSDQYGSEARDGAQHSAFGRNVSHTGTQRTIGERAPTAVSARSQSQGQLLRLQLPLRLFGSVSVCSAARVREAFDIERRVEE